MFLSNKVVENQVKTYITYNKGRDWHLLQAPATDLQGNKVYCEEVSGPLTGGRYTYLDFHYLLSEASHCIMLYYDNAKDSENIPRLLTPLLYLGLKVICEF